MCKKLKDATGRCTGLSMLRETLFFILGSVGKKVAH
jgi:hypothetical protein